MTGTAAGDDMNEPLLDHHNNLVSPLSELQPLTQVQTQLSQTPPCLPSQSQAVLRSFNPNQQRNESEELLSQVKNNSYQNNKNNGSSNNNNSNNNSNNNINNNNNNNSNYNTTTTNSSSNYNNTNINNNDNTNNSSSNSMKKSLVTSSSATTLDNILFPATTNLLFSNNTGIQTPPRNILTISDTKKKINESIQAIGRNMETIGSF
jgi:hypothetical protein